MRTPKLHPQSLGYPLRDTYIAVAHSYAFIRAPLNGDILADVGFMYPIDAPDKMVKRLERRIRDSEREAEKMSLALKLGLENREKYLLDGGDM